MEKNLRQLLERQYEDYRKLSETLADYEKAYNRSQYLLENAISYIADNDLLEDFISDRDIDFTREEKKYFEI